ncbi:MAG TPA: DedA family protein [Propionibacteriaceae bacterium]
MSDEQPRPDGAPDPDPTLDPVDPVADEDREREWWEDPRLPWKGKPGRRDIACWIAFSLTGVYALVLLPLRPILLGANPYLLAGLGGSRTSAVTIGALAATGVGWWPLGLLLGTIGAVKFDWVFWWAGKLWGRGLIEIVAGRSPRAARNADRAERLAKKYGVAAVLLGYVIPLPSGVIYATLGATGMRLRTFILIDVIGAASTRAIYIYLGYRIGQPAVNVVQVIAKYSLWLSLALLAGVIFSAVRQSARRRSASRQAQTGEGGTSGGDDDASTRRRRTAG